MSRSRAVAAVPAALLLLTLLAPAAAAQPAPEVVPIGSVQGAVGDDADGPTFASPLEGDIVTVQAVITQTTLTGSGFSGLFVQNTLWAADDDPTTSDGIFVFIPGRLTTLRRDDGGLYQPQVGDEVILRGPVSEFFDLTQISNPFVAAVVRSGVVLDDETPAFAADPPDDLDEAGRYWERREGMRAAVPAGAAVLGGRDVFGDADAGADGEVWVVRGDHPIAQRDDPYAERAYRDPHPLDNVPGELFDDGNGYRILLGSLGLKGATGSRTALIAPARTYDTVTNAAVGGLYYSFGKYQIQPAAQIELAPGVDPAGNAPPQPATPGAEYAAAIFNVENLYDYRDDPFDGCDFAGNAGCPGVRPPFDYVPGSDREYRARLGELAAQITGDLHAPDILAVQEVEDQDVCVVDAGALVCGDADDADGKPDTLQELALVIAEQGGPAYDAAYDRDGADDRGIVSAFLYRTDRVELLPPDPADPVLGGAPAVDYRGAAAAYNADVSNPKALNADLPDDVDTSTGTDGDQVFTRAPQVARFRVWRTAVGQSVFTDLYAVSNHFSSNPEARVGQRTEQAAYNAAIADALGDARIVVGGDFNVYPRPDDPLIDSDQLGPLYEAGLTNLYDVLLAEVPAAAYSYVFQGQTQTLDQQFVTDPLLAELRGVRVAHVNTDFPEAFDGDGPRGASDHDPQAARFTTAPTIDRLADLVTYYADTGLVSPPADELLLRRLDAAERAAERGDLRRARIQLLVFRILVRALSPHLVDPAAAEVLEDEAALVAL